jgi:hypothetical protein
MREVPDLIPYEEGPKFRPGFNISRHAADAPSVYVSWAFRVAVESQLLADMMLPFSMTPSAQD